MKKVFCIDWRSICWYNDEGQDDDRCEGCNCKDKKSECSGPSSILPSLINFGRTEMRVGLEDRIDKQLPNVGRDVEQEGKPTNPVEELNLTDFAYLGRQTF